MNTNDWMSNDWISTLNEIFPSFKLPSNDDPSNVTYIKYETPEPSHTYRLNMTNMPKVKSVIFNKRATIVYFEDGTKCIVRKSDHDEYNREHAVVYAIVKRAYGIVNEDGTVDGNGMGNMLAKIVANGYDQEAHEIAERTKRIKKRKEAKASVNKNRDLKNIYNANLNRDSMGRFVKKSNRP